MSVVGFSFSAILVALWYSNLKGCLHSVTNWSNIFFATSQLFLSATIWNFKLIEVCLQMDVTHVLNCSVNKLLSAAW